MHSVTAFIVASMLAVAGSLPAQEDVERALALAEQACMNQRYGDAVRLLKPLADAGDARAQTMLAVLHANGQGVERDYIEARALLELATLDDVGAAWFHLALLVRDGLGAPADPERAARLFKAAAHAGDWRGAQELASMYLTGTGVPREPARAIELLRSAADGDFAPAQLDLARLLLAGEVVARDVEDAAKQLRRAMGSGTTTVVAKRMLEELAATEPVAARELGIGICRRPMQDAGRRADRSEALLIAAHERGDPLGTAYLGEFYLAPGPTRDEAKAEGLLTQAADAGVEEARLRLARQLRARGTRENDTPLVARGTLMAIAAADRGFPAARQFIEELESGKDASYCLVMGLRYQDGEGVSRDLHVAEKWFRRADDAGHPSALERLLQVMVRQTPLRLPEALRELRVRAGSDPAAARLLADVEREGTLAGVPIPDAESVGATVPAMPAPPPGSGRQSLERRLAGAKEPIDLSQFWTDYRGLWQSAQASQAGTDELDALRERLVAHVENAERPDRVVLIALALATVSDVKNQPGSEDRLTRAFELLERAATGPDDALEEGMVEAAERLGEMRLTFAIERFRDAVAGEHWLLRAAARGSPTAARRLGLHLVKGDSPLGRDVARGKQIWTEAFERGNAAAGFDLAQRAFAEKDEATAMRWLAAAGRAGCDEATTVLLEYVARANPRALLVSGTAILDGEPKEGPVDRDQRARVQNGARAILRAARAGDADAQRYVVDNLETAHPEAAWQFADYCLRERKVKRRESARILFDRALLHNGLCCLQVAMSYVDGFADGGATIVSKDRLRALYWLREARALGTGGQAQDGEVRRAIAEIEKLGYLLPDDADPLATLVPKEQLAALSEPHKRELRILAKEKGEQVTKRVAEELWHTKYRNRQPQPDTPFDPRVELMRIVADLHRQPGGQRWQAAYWLERAEALRPTKDGNSTRLDFVWSLDDIEKAHLAAKREEVKAMPPRTYRAR